MSAIYLTGTRSPGKSLKRFLPDYLDMLAQQGEALITTNKPGVDRLVIGHCEQESLPLQVIEFACDSGESYRNRRVTSESHTVQVRRVVSPSWQRFRYLTDQADKIQFFHAAKTRGPSDLPTAKAFELACDRRGIDGEQHIVQCQHAIWVSETALRNAPTIGAAHIYLYARFLPGLDGERHSIGYYRLDTWRRIGGVVQPGEGRREIVLPQVKSHYRANLLMLRQALRMLDHQRPARLIIHYNDPYLARIQTAAPSDADIRHVQDLLKSYPQIVWRKEKPAELRHQIGKPVSKAQALWHHVRRARAYRGLYQ